MDLFERSLTNAFFFVIISPVILALAKVKSIILASLFSILNTKNSEMKRRLSELLPKERYEHSLAVEKVASDLASHHGISSEKASIAGLLHDSARGLGSTGLIKKAREIGLHIDPIQRFEPKLLHAPLSAHIAKEEFGITDPEILLAIERHTVGAEEMSPLEKVIYLADHIEPGRDYEGVEKIRSLAYKNMDKAIAECASLMIKALIRKDLPVYPLTVITRNFYILESLKTKECATKEI